MNAEGTREREIQAHVWVLPPGMKNREAFEYWVQHVKPAGFVFEKWGYFASSGKFFAL